MGQRLGFTLVVVLGAITASACGSGFSGSIKSEVKTAQDLIADKKYEEAGKILAPVLERDPKDARALLQAAIVDEHTKHMEDAWGKLDKAVDADPTYAEAYSQRALVKTKFQRNSEALADVNQAIMLEPNEPQHHLRRALVALGSKDWRMTLDSLDQVEKLEGSGEKAKDAYWIAAYRAEAYLGMRDYQRAMGYYDEAVKLGGDKQPVVYLRRANCRARTGDFDGARADAAKFVKAKPQDPSAHALLGALLCAKGDNAAGAREYEKAMGKTADGKQAAISAGDLADTVDLGADYAGAVTTLVDLYLAKHDADTAGAVLTRVEAHRPLEPTEEYREALVAFDTKQTDRAVTLLNACIAMAPDYVAPRVELIRYYAGKGMTTKAMELQREAYGVAKTAHDRSEVAGAMVGKHR